MRQPEAGDAAVERSRPTKNAARMSRRAAFNRNDDGLQALCSNAGQGGEVIGPQHSHIGPHIGDDPSQQLGRRVDIARTVVRNTIGGDANLHAIGSHAQNALREVTDNHAGLVCLSSAIDRQLGSRKPFQVSDPLKSVEASG